MSTLVPGLLQTADYAREIIKVFFPASRPELIEQQVAVRIRRQAVLRRTVPPQVSAVIDEAALHRIVGSPALMKVQFDHLIEEAARPNISIRVIPYGQGVYPAIDNDFVILEFPGPVNGIVYTEGLFGFIYLEREHDVRRYADAFRETQSLAASELDSLDLISGISRELDR